MQKPLLRSLISENSNNNTYIVTQLQYNNKQNEQIIQLLNSVERLSYFLNQPSKSPDKLIESLYNLKLYHEAWNFLYLIPQYQQLNNQQQNNNNQEQLKQQFEQQIHNQIYFDYKIIQNLQTQIEKRLAEQNGIIDLFELYKQHIQDPLKLLNVGTYISKNIEFQYFQSDILNSYSEAIAKATIQPDTILICESTNFFSDHFNKFQQRNEILKNFQKFQQKINFLPQEIKNRIDNQLFEEENQSGLQIFTIFDYQTLSQQLEWNNDINNTNNTHNLSYDTAQNNTQSNQSSSNNNYSQNSDINIENSQIILQKNLKSSTSTTSDNQSENQQFNSQNNINVNSDNTNNIQTNKQQNNQQQNIDKNNNQTLFNPFTILDFKKTQQNDQQSKGSESNNLEDQNCNTITNNIHITQQYENIQQNAIHSQKSQKSTQTPLHLTQQQPSTSLGAYKNIAPFTLSPNPNCSLFFIKNVAIIKSNRKIFKAEKLSINPLDPMKSPLNGYYEFHDKITSEFHMKDTNQIYHFKRLENLIFETQSLFFRGFNETNNINQQQTSNNAVNNENDFKNDSNNKVNEDKNKNTTKTNNYIANQWNNSKIYKFQQLLLIEKLIIYGNQCEEFKQFNNNQNEQNLFQYPTQDIHLEDISSMKEFSHQYIRMVHVYFIQQAIYVNEYQLAYNFIRPLLLHNNPSFNNIDDKLCKHFIDLQKTDYGDIYFIKQLDILMQRLNKSQKLRRQFYNEVCQLGKKLYGFEESIIYKMHLDVFDDMFIPSINENNM